MDKIRVDAIFGENVFSDAVMYERLPREAYLELLRVRQGEADLQRETANVIAEAMRNWAVEKGATHFCHWFQPLTGYTAEKQDAFISAPDRMGKVLSLFSGKELIKGEPDASSFPSGGLRATFEARGYTAWDCTSPAFVREDASGTTLYIPTAFCSYTGESLDKKTPLLRSMEAIGTQALRLLRLFGNTSSSSVKANAGAEQEFFIVDRKRYLKREDLMFAGRTLFGAKPPKGQEMGDHYMGTIPERVGAYMRDVDEVLWKLGVPAKTQHNEAAPAQHELAPIYEEANIATDHNQLVMETLKQVAGRHGLMCLLHEKPFRGVNGSGKHNNWSLSTDDGLNLLDPGKTPHENLQFLLILACMIRAVDRHAGLLRESSADVGNEERLGGNEAPPCIISMFLGTQLEDIIEQIVATGEVTSSREGGKMHTGVYAVPDFEKDATDRNRTSPFAFTGNKFEFRSVGSMDSIAEPNVVLNTIAAEAFREAADVLEKADDLNTSVQELIQCWFMEHQRVIYSGNNYAKEWTEEAKRRGLPIITNMVDAAGELLKEDTVRLYESFGIYTRAELESRAQIQYEIYAKAINIEARTMIDMAGKQILPAVIRAIGEMASSMNSVKSAGIGADTSVQEKLVIMASGYLKDAQRALQDLKETADQAAAMEPGFTQAAFYRDGVVPCMEALRTPVDALEMMIDKRMWPIPAYSDLMYEI